jgi:hypothetical protein
LPERGAPGRLPSVHTRTNRLAWAVAWTFAAAAPFEYVLLPASLSWWLAPTLATPLVYLLNLRSTATPRRHLS